MKDKIDVGEAVKETLALPGFILMFIGPFVVIGFQLYYWLRTGEWFPISLFDALNYIGIDASGLRYASDWRGLAIAVLWVLELPLSLMVIAIGGAWVVFMASLEDNDSSI